jgi:hypothetical protein
MIAIGRGIDFGVLAGRALGTVVVAGGWLLSAGAGAGLAQTPVVTSSVTFQYLTAPNTTSITAVPGNPAEGSITYLGNGLPFNQTGNEFFSNIDGIKIVDPAFTDPTSTQFSYKADGANSSITNVLSFYFIGDTTKCSICGTATTPPPESSYITVPDSTNALIFINALSSDVSNVIVSGGSIPINFGNTGQTGTISFAANNIVTNADGIGLFPGTGSISFQVFQSTKVPGPLPILGASTAFAFSRKLRRRVASANASISTYKPAA